MQQSTDIVVQRVDVLGFLGSWHARTAFTLDFNLPESLSLSIASDSLLTSIINLHLPPLDRSLYPSRNNVYLSGHGPFPGGPLRGGIGKPSGLA